MSQKSICLVTEPDSATPHSNIFLGSLTVLCLIICYAVLNIITQLFSIDENGRLNVWECDTELNGLKPYEEPDRGDNQVEISDEEMDPEGVTDKEKPSGT